MDKFEGKAIEYVIVDDMTPAAGVKKWLVFNPDSAEPHVLPVVSKHIPKVSCWCQPQWVSQGPNGGSWVHNDLN